MRCVELIQIIAINKLNVTSARGKLCYLLCVLPRHSSHLCELDYGFSLENVMQNVQIRYLPMAFIRYFNRCVLWLLLGENGDSLSVYKGILSAIGRTKFHPKPIGNILNHSH